MELEEAIATLNPEEQIRAHRALDHKGALIFMGQVEEHSYYDYEGMTKDQAHLLKLAKLSEDEFELALTALNQIKSHPIIFEMFSDYKFHRLDCLVNFNVNKALEFLNNVIITEWVQNFRSLSTLTQFPLSKVKTLISHPNIKQIITDVRELKFIFYSTVSINLIISEYFTVSRYVFIAIILYFLFKKKNRNIYF